MKRFLLLGLVFLILGAALFADDAKVMPLRTGRLSLAPSLTYGVTSFDAGGRRLDNASPLGSGIIKVFNFGAALEYGIISWITGAVQWAPGINVWSNVDMDMNLFALSQFGFPSGSSARVYDMGDLFVGAKVQILGKEAPVKTDNFRLAFAPGVKIPLPGPDFKDQFENLQNGYMVTVSTMDNHAVGVGLRSYFDYIINDKFFVNFYNETLFYVTKPDLNKAGLTEYLTSMGVNSNFGPGAVPAGMESSVEGKVNYGMELTFEFEPTFSTPIADGLLFTTSLPITYKTSSGKKYEFTGSGVLGDTAVDAIKGALPDGDRSHSLSIDPGVAIMFYKWFIPMEFELNYKSPVWGMNASSNHTFVFIAKVFFKI